MADGGLARATGIVNVPRQGPKEVTTQSKPCELLPS